MNPRPANPPDSAASCAAEFGPGWFGKIPSLGDFVTRRLPPSFVEPWDEWLSAELSEARSVLAERWDLTYACAPIACFLLGAKALDEHAWQGILVPSFDRVRREFPLTLALCLRQHDAATLRRQGWAALVAAARRALEPACGADGVDEALAALFGHEGECARRTEPDAAHLERAAASPGEGRSAWWSWSAQETRDPPARIFDGLPRGACFRELLLAC
jgi:type VI secretion system protein ImpM